MKKRLEITLRVSPLKRRSKRYFQRSILSFINGWLRWKKHEENRGYSTFSTMKLIGSSALKGKSTDYLLSYMVDIGGYTSQFFNIKDIRHYE